MQKFLRSNHGGSFSKHKTTLFLKCNSFNFTL